MPRKRNTPSPTAGAPIEDTVESTTYSPVSLVEMLERRLVDQVGEMIKSAVDKRIAFDFIKNDIVRKLTNDENSGVSPNTINLIKRLNPSKDLKKELRKIYGSFIQENKIKSRKKLMVLIDPELKRYGRWAKHLGKWSEWDIAVVVDEEDVYAVNGISDLQVKKERLKDVSAQEKYGDNYYRQVEVIGHGGYIESFLAEGMDSTKVAKNVRNLLSSIKLDRLSKIRIQVCNAGSFKPNEVDTFQELCTPEHLTTSAPKWYSLALKDGDYVDLPYQLSFFGDIKKIVSYSINPAGKERPAYTAIVSHFLEEDEYLLPYKDLIRVLKEKFSNKSYTVVCQKREPLRGLGVSEIREAARPMARARVQVSAGARVLAPPLRINAGRASRERSSSRSGDSI